MPEISRDIRAATLVVAANDSINKNMADYVCRGIDDHLVIQAALDALPAFGGKVFLLDGTYYIEVSLVLDSYQTLEGCGRNTILTTTTAALNIITATGGAGTEKLDIVLTNFYIDATDGGVTANIGVFFTYVDHSRIIDIWSMNHNGDGINLLTCDDNLVIGCELSSNGTGIILDHSERAIIIGNLLENNSWYTIDAWYAHNSTITGNRLRNNADEGIIIDYCEGCTVTANALVGGTTGINLNYATETSVVGNTVEDFDSYCIALNNSNKNTISGNNIHNSAYRNMEMSASDYNLITGNEIHEASREGLRISNCDHNLIEGNHFHTNSQQTNNNYDSLYLYDGDYNMISNNIFRRGVEANKPRYAINISNANCDRTRITGNDLYDSGTTTAINDAGTLTEMWEQYCDIFMDVLAVLATHVRSNEDLSAGVPITFTLDAQPDVPRTLSGHFDAHANITAYTIDIVGVDGKGRPITETMTEADGWDWETSNAFATITSITMSARTGTGAGDTMDIGITDVLGLSNGIYVTGDVYKIKKNNANATVAGAQVDVTYDTYDMAVIGLAATDDFTIWFRSQLNRVS